jgi:drug/metabolite transporter (DMT)-like permease
MQRIWTAILLASVGWGTGGVATRAAYDEGVEPYTLVMWRTLIAAAAVFVYLALRRRSVSRDERVWKVGLVMGTLNLAGPFLLFAVAYEYASAGFVGLLAAMIPVATAGLAHFLLPNEPMKAAKLGGLLIALVGVAVLILSGDSGLAEDGRPLLAFGLGVGAVSMIAFAGIYAKRYAGEYEPMEVAGIQFASGSAVIIVATLIVEGVPAGETAAGWGLITYAAAASTFMPFLIFYWLLRQVSVSYASLVGYIVPLIAVGAGIGFLSERLDPGIAIGGALILVGVVLSDRIEQRRLVRAA